MSTDENTIVFMAQPTKEVMRITCDKIFISEGVAVDEATQGVISALQAYVQNLAQRAVMAEREACATLCDGVAGAAKMNTAVLPESHHRMVAADDCADLIRARSHK